MNMNEIARQKYMLLMQEIEELEDKIEDKGIISAGIQNASDDDMELLDELAEKRNELARLSDGCGEKKSC